jgi:pimeloyl-ACP methyl ester carboxylesterase
MSFLQLKDTELYYEVHGRGQPIVFLSETACDGEVWKIHQVEEFSRDHRVILHDYRGTGRSGKPSIDYSTKMFCDDAAALMDHLGSEKAIVVGHSMGGRIAQLLALEHPDKVDKLISHPPALLSQPPKASSRLQEMISGVIKNIRDHSILVGFTDEFAKSSPPCGEIPPGADGESLPVEFYLRHLIARQSRFTAATSQDIRVPTLILVGEDDRNVTSDINHRSSSEILAQGIPKAKLVVLPGERHSYFFANPDAAHRALREFIKSS